MLNLRCDPEIPYWWRSSTEIQQKFKTVQPTGGATQIICIAMSSTWNFICWVSDKERCLFNQEGWRMVFQKIQLSQNFSWMSWVHQSRFLSGSVRFAVSIYSQSRLGVLILQSWSCNLILPSRKVSNLPFATLIRLLLIIALLTFYLFCFSFFHHHWDYR